MVGGKEIPGSRGEIGAYIAKVFPGGVAEQMGKIVEGKTRMRKRCGSPSSEKQGVNLICYMFLATWCLL